MNDDELLTGVGATNPPAASNPSLDTILKREGALNKQIDQLRQALKERTTERDSLKTENCYLKAGDIWKKEAAAAKVNPLAMDDALKLSGWLPGEKPSDEEARKALAELKKRAPYFFEPDNPKPAESDPAANPGGIPNQLPQPGYPGLIQGGFPQTAGNYANLPQAPHSGKGRGVDGVLPQTLSAADLRNPGLMGRLTPKEILAMT